MHYDWEQNGWKSQLSNQCRPIGVNISGTVFPDSDLQVMAELLLQGAQYLRPILYGFKETDGKEA